MADKDKAAKPEQDPKQSQPTLAQVEEEAGSLEKPATAVAPAAQTKTKKSLKERVIGISRGTNLYMLGFIFVVSGFF